jgi:hypothetical protein
MLISPLPQQQLSLSPALNRELILYQLLCPTACPYKGQVFRVTLVLFIAQGLAPESRTDLAAKKVMAKVGGAKAAELDRLNGELAVSRAELESLKFKYDGALSRWVAVCTPHV